MAFEENLNININSVFDSTGFRQMRSALKRMRAEAAKAEAQLESLGTRGGQGRGGSMFGGQIRGTNFKEDPMASVRNMQTPDAEIGRFRSRILRLSATTEIAGKSIAELRNDITRMAVSANVGSFSVRRLAARMKSGAASAAAMAGGIKNLQMKLLGLQFTMLTVAFIFGGMMAGALGAVGVFRVLGNTLKFLFLPTALDVLGGVLDLQEAIFGLDEATRRNIGRIFGWITLISVGIGLLAALGKAVITVVGGLKFFGSILLNLGRALMWVVKAVNIVQAAFIAGFAIATAAFKMFGDVVGTIITGILVVIGGLIAFFFSLPVGIALALGAAAAFVWNFRKEIFSALKSIAGFIAIVGKAFLNSLLWPFRKAYQILVGNSIIPDIVNGIISWLGKLPGKAFDLAKNMVNNIIRGIKGAGSGIWNAFKKVLPDFLVDALKKGGQAVKGIVKAGGEIVGKAGETIGNVAGGIADKAGDLAGGVKNAAQNAASGIGNFTNNLTGGGGNQGQTNVQNNQINADVNIQNQEESPQETGQKFGEGLSQGLNNQNSNISSGT